MRKNSSAGVVCIKCAKPALPDTDPPVCEEHRKLSKKAAKKTKKTIKEL